MHHGFSQDGPDDYMDMDSKESGTSGRSGRIILLGDGTEVLTDNGDQDPDMFDQSEDDEKDLENQIKKGQSETETEGDRSQRGETPGPQEGSGTSKQGTGPGSTPDEPKMMAATDNMPADQLQNKIDAQQ